MPRCEIENLSFTDKVKLLVENIKNGKLSFKSENFKKNLTASDNTLQEVFDKFDSFQASEQKISTEGFNRNLSQYDDTLVKALLKFNDFSATPTQEQTDKALQKINEKAITQETQNATSPHFVIDDDITHFNPVGDTAGSYVVKLPTKEGATHNVIVVAGGRADSSYKVQLADGTELLTLRGKESVQVGRNGGEWYVIKTTKKEYRRIYAKDFGLAGDGINNDYTALKTFFTTPANEYMFEKNTTYFLENLTEDTIEFPSNAIVIGNNTKFRTKTKFGSDAENRIFISKNTENLDVMGIKFYGDVEGVQDDKNSKGLIFHGGSNIKFAFCEFDALNQHQLYFRKDDSLNSDNLDIPDWMVDNDYNSKASVVKNMSMNCRNITVHDCIFRNAKSSDLAMFGVTNGYIHNNKAYDMPTLQNIDNIGTNIFADDASQTTKLGKYAINKNIQVYDNYVKGIIDINGTVGGRVENNVCKKVIVRSYDFDQQKANLPNGKPPFMYFEHFQHVRQITVSGNSTTYITIRGGGSPVVSNNTFVSEKDGDIQLEFGSNTVLWGDGESYYDDIGNEGVAFMNTFIAKHNNIVGITYQKNFAALKVKTVNNTFLEDGGTFKNNKPIIRASDDWVLDYIYKDKKVYKDRAINISDNISIYKRGVSKGSTRLEVSEDGETQRLEFGIGDDGKAYDEQHGCAVVGKSNRIEFWSTTATGGALARQWMFNGKNLMPTIEGANLGDNGNTRRLNKVYLKELHLLDSDGTDKKVTLVNGVITVS